MKFKLLVSGGLETNNDDNCAHISIDDKGVSVQERVGLGILL